jgi:hypothetical protein
MTVELLEKETEAMSPRVLPADWRRRSDFVNGIYSDHYQLSVVWSVERIDGQVWRHLSVAGADRLPTYDELAKIKNWLLGPESKAIQVFAPASQHINVCQHALHLWSPVGFDPLPDFRREGGL